MRRIGALTEVNAGGGGLVPKTIRAASPTTATTMSPATMPATLAMGDFVGMSDRVTRESLTMKRFFSAMRPCAIAPKPRRKPGIAAPATRDAVRVIGHQ